MAAYTKKKPPVKRKAPVLKSTAQLTRGQSKNVSTKKVENGYLVTCSFYDNNDGYQNQEYIAKTAAEAKKKAASLL